MNRKKIYIGNVLVNNSQSEVKGEFVDIDNNRYYKISNYDRMPDFFMSIVSDSDHWMFISSTGSLTAGRKNRDSAIFPYYTVDKIHDYNNTTGSKTLLIVKKEDKSFLWEPFTEYSPKFYKVTRNIYKSYYGNSIIFEEVNHDLGLSFRYGWYNSAEYGFVKKSTVINNAQEDINFEVLDGIQNILPYGVDYSFQNEYSNLLDAYKKNERVKGSPLGLFMLSSIPVDRAEPSEALLATSVWSCGMDEKSIILISGKQLDNFRSGMPLQEEYDIKASRGAYFINSKITLEAGKGKKWLTVVEANQDSTKISNLNNFITKSNDLISLVERDIDRGTVKLDKMVSCADGSQVTNTELCFARHFTNTLFNIMRGGIFAENYTIDTDDFVDYLLQINRLVAKEYHVWLNNLPDQLLYTDLLKLVSEIKDTDLLRLTYEYLPLTFSRRHGDPSRPWNQFSIETKNEDGSIKYNYEGNWRDIFQNWEALCFSYPEFVEGIICKFVNASTIDGYNPYRIMRNGIDWESPNPDDPWSYIGYWGDHQIIYLQKLLELSNNFHPGKLEELLTNEIFTYANVPYQIKPYNEILQNPKDTVVFNYELENKIKSEVEHLGADAKLLKNKVGDHIYKVNLSEKILVTLLSKMCNFIPEAGIWLNTQRPEWNDANNALVGNGTSMVTLYYLRRFLKFWNSKFKDVNHVKLIISEEVATLYKKVYEILNSNTELLDKGFNNADRKKITDLLGDAHSKYRTEIYSYLFSGEKTKVKVSDLIDFTDLCIRYIDQSIKVNKRKDGLYHAYNLISLKKDGISIRNLYEMLEGQVAILSSGYLSVEDSLKVLDSLKNSAIYRPDQYSYMLYPDRQLPRFMDKNIIPEKLVKKSALFKKLMQDGETSIIQVDEDGECHFNGSFRNSYALEQSLDELRIGSYSQLIEKEKDLILNIYENIFDHKSFTGRSGTFYGYEGLGSIYWHMVSKLLLSTQECYFKAVDEGVKPSIIGRLKNHYYEIKAGIGLYKSPDLYGAFPTDAYSHTPSNAGVKQPGLTGQVKEDIISRIGEMGVVVRNGKIAFEPSLLNEDEILSDNKSFSYYAINGKKQLIELKSNQIGFTYCQVPIIYNFCDNQSVTVKFDNNYVEKFSGNTITNELSDLIFSRNGQVKSIEVNIQNK